MSLAKSLAESVRLKSQIFTEKQRNSVTQNVNKVSVKVTTCRITTRAAAGLCIQRVVKGREASCASPPRPRLLAQVLRKRVIVLLLLLNPAASASSSPGSGRRARVALPRPSKPKGTGTEANAPHLMLPEQPIMEPQTAGHGGNLLQSGSFWNRLPWDIVPLTHHN